MSKIKRKLGKTLQVLTALAICAGSLSAVPASDIRAAEESVYLYGDPNRDGIISTSDLSAVKAYLLSNYQPNDSMIVKSMDVTGDGDVTDADAKLLAEYILGKASAFTAGVYVPAQTLPDVYWAIEATYHEAIEETINSGFAGEAYVNYHNNANSYIVWNVDAEQSGNYAVSFRYANGTSSDRTCRLYLSGDRTQYYEISFPSTGTWTDWQTTTVVLPLTAGSNIIKLQSALESGGPNVDYLALAPTSEETAIAKEITPGTVIGSGKYQADDLNRGAIAVNTGNGILVSWRMLATDDENTVYKVYRNGVNQVLYEGTIANATCYLDKNGTTADWYTVDVYQAGACTEFACYATQLYNKVSSGGVMSIPLSIPNGVTTPDGVTCTYSPNDCTVGDVDGDGEYEIILKWDPSNAKDNAQSGYTGNVYIDCYKLNGKQLWRIDLGRNIRAGAHYTQMVCGDFDSDGKAELCMKTSDGTVDGQGTVIGNANADYRNSSGYILTGNEYYTLFDGETGKALDTIDYKPARGNVSGWGDNYGNRVDRFLGAVTYIDGKQCAITVRGYYTRLTAVCYTVVNDKLVEKWYFDTNNAANSAAFGDGNHNCMTADVDGDGNFELVLGASCIDDDGSLLWCNENGHGDAMHLGPFQRNSDKIYLWCCHENAPFGCSLIDAATGKTIFRNTGTKDTGRCMAGNFIAGNGGTELACGSNGNLYDLQGNAVGSWSEITKWGMNSAVYWDGDLEREVLDRTMVDKYGVGRLFTGSDMAYNNGSKSNACLTADILGDWREEMIFGSGDGSMLHIVSTAYETQYGMHTLMQDAQYRCQVAGQNITYNQPPNPSFWLGTGDPTPAQPSVYLVK